MKKTKEITKTSELLPQKRNANRGTERGFQVLENSLRNLGFGRSIVVDRKGRIIGGNHTTEKAVEIGLDNVVTVRTKGDKVVVHVREDLDFDEDSRAAQLAIADNRTGELNLEWDAEILAAIKEHGEVDLSALGFTDKEVNEVLKEIERDTVDAPDAEIDRAEELLRKWKVKRGDIWETHSLTVRGQRHRLMCGDSTLKADVSRLLDGATPQMIFTDPPYNALKSWRKDEAHSETRLDPRKWFANDNMEWSEYGKFLVAAVNLLQGHSAYICCDFRVYPIVVSALVGGGWDVKHCIVWKKNCFGLGKRYRFQHEFIVYACRGDAPFYGDRAQSDVWEFDKETPDDSFHSTMKPITLPGRAIENSSTSGGAILDVFNGTGTVTVAAEQLGRVCYGMEIEPKYVAVSLERLSQMGLISKLVKPGKRKR